MDRQGLVAGARTKHEVNRYHMMATARLRQDDSRREQSREAIVSTRLMAQVQGAMIAMLRHQLASVTLSMTTTNSPSGVFMQASVVAKKSVETSLPAWLISQVRGST